MVDGHVDLTAKLLEHGNWLDIETADVQEFTAYSGPSLWQNYSSNEFI
jgi:hypothetical protein